MPPTRAGLPGLLSAALLVGCAGGNLGPTEAVPIDVPRRPAASVAPSPEYDALLGLINAARREAGLIPLVWSDALAAAAQGHAEDLSRRDALSHTGSDGSTPGQRASRAGYPWSAVAENVAGSTHEPMPPEVVFRGWMESPGHRGNILHPRVVHAGVSRAGRCWVLLLARRADGAE